MRSILAVAGLVVVVGLGYLGFSSMEGTGQSDASGRELSSIEEKLAVQGPMGDLFLGDPNAPITIYEYASLTCSHCGTFHREIYPELKSKYIDTGKVRFILRPFSFDGAATAAFMISRCAGDDRYYKFIDALFDAQNQWIRGEETMTALANIAKQGGFTKESFGACLQRADILADLQAVFKQGSEEIGVNSTPTFYINGEMFSGVPVNDAGQPDFAVFEKILLKHLPES